MSATLRTKRIGYDTFLVIENGMYRLDRIDAILWDNEQIVVVIIGGRQIKTGCADYESLIGYIKGRVKNDE